MTDLTSEQKKRIEYLSTDAWVVDSGSPSDEAMSTANFRRTLALMSSIELHHFACNFNWDCGVDELLAVVGHPECDAGTAMMIFWLGQPVHYYRRYQRGKLEEHEQPVFDLLRIIENRLELGEFSHSKIACDPSNIMGQPMTMGSESHREVLNSRLFIKLDGESVDPYLL